MSSQVLPSQALPSRFRGLYHRVAKRLGVDPSYVSRVARQERQSEAVSAELRKEVARILSASRAVLAESISAQLDLALTFSKQARKAISNGEGANGYVGCAHQSADCAFKFMGKLKMEPGEFEQMKAKAERLRVELQSLGQDLRRAGDNGTGVAAPTI
jgi:hypothetical protein